MAKFVRISLPDYKVSCVAELHEDLAPKTCKAIRKVLPHQGKARHAMWAGHEVWTKLTPNAELKRVPRENLVVYPKAGDCLYGYFPPAWEGGYRDMRESVCDFAIWYGLDSPVYQVDGLHPMNGFATIVDGLDKFAKVAEKLIIEGEKKIVIEKYKEGR